jgi:hypothetical protein
MAKHSCNPTTSQYWKNNFLKLDRLERRIVNLEAKLTLPAGGTIRADSAAGPSFKDLAHPLSATSHKGPR